ncbi:MAG: carboxypeptidase-like regulatory domain-containing protein [Cyclobacteriaceae bacterium]
MKRSFLILIVIFYFPLLLQAQQRITINGYIKDASNGEDLIGASVLVRETGTGTITNMYGFYSISLPAGSYTLEFRYVGYDNLQRELELSQNTRIDVELKPEQQQLDEIVVTAMGDNVTSTEMSTVKLDIKTIKSIPAFLGEVDVIKSIQLLPGVSTVGEGASGFNVRGGGVGQNLVLLDEAPVYNASHLFGFFSVFNPDAVKEVKLYKGGIPARYGGRISSILDIRMKEGNNKKFEVNGGIGTVFSRLSVEGPIVKDKGSFVIAARRSYADVLVKLATDVLSDGAALNFYDLTGKANYNLNDKNRLFVSGYLGRDVFRFDADQGFNWGNKTATLRWNKLYNDRLFSNLTVFFSDYDYSLGFGDFDVDAFEWNSRISTSNFKPEFNYYINSDNELSFGGEFIHYRFVPARARGISNGEVTNISLENKTSLEYAIYASNEQKIGDKLQLSYGIRYSAFNYIGPGSVYEFGEAERPGKRRPVVGISEASSGESIATYGNFEPRASFTFLINSKSSIKGSYNRTAQYIHLVSNTVASNPLDVWTPSTNNIKPQTGQQVALGYFRDFGARKTYESSAEVYYRATKDQIDYIDGADILINEFLAGDLLSGIGRAYGLETFIKKREGKLTGWISYTLAKTELQVEGINQGEWYPTRFDQRHNLKVAGFYEWTDKFSVSANFTWLSGTPTTFPDSRYINQDYVIPYIYGDVRNGIRIPDFHRLDLSAILKGKTTNRKGEPRRFTSEYVFSIYNVYGRRNPFSIYFSQSDERRPAGIPAETSATRLAIIGTLFPSISYNFKF